jgi:hypothetical protein
MRQLLSNSILGIAGISLFAVSSQLTLAAVPINVAVIINSGSTNTIGYRIYVTPSGQVTYVDGKGQGKGKLSPTLTKKFFADIQTAEPLSNLPVKTSCVKPVSFGTSTTIRLGGEQSPDVSCPGNALASKLNNDVVAIAKALKVKNILNKQGHPLPVQNF